MIHLASDPNASRTGWRPAAAQGDKNPPKDARSRSGHAWPFLSRHVQQPQPKNNPTPARGEPASDRDY